ncbi:Hypothetical_protein [Hexamita inflata]|uniref:Hypothetical_protein n=1 Tax=Hexamita inflata TaxID=28002 RepID=A0AA86N8Q2_9EUKA|nr:Hypothetical protein HINF_LOCUS2563 [Hexamita inflata]
MDPAQLSDSDFEVIADYSNKPITKLIQKVNLEPDFKKEFLRQPIIKTFNPNRFVNPHINQFSIQEVDNLVFKGIPSGYIQKDVVNSETILGLLLFESRTQAIEILKAKTTIRNKAAVENQFACCFNDLHNMIKPKEKIDEQPTVNGELDLTELISIFEAEQKENCSNDSIQEENEEKEDYFGRKINSFKNECKRTASVVSIKGSTINKTKKRYCDEFEYIITSGGEILSFDKISNDITYYQVKFQKGTHHTGINPCYFRRILTRCKFNEKETRLLLNFQNQFSYDRFDAFWTFNQQHFTKSKQQVQTKLRQMYEDNVEQAEQLYQYILIFNLRLQIQNLDQTSFWAKQIIQISKKLLDYYLNFKIQFLFIFVTLHMKYSGDIAFRNCFNLQLDRLTWAVKEVMRYLFTLHFLFKLRYYSFHQVSWFD